TSAALLMLPAYALFAYVVMPVSWRQYHRIAGGRAVACVTRTAEGIPADPLNVALVGSTGEVVAAMQAAGWSPADRISIRSGIRDAASVVFHRPYASAPMSTHLLWGRPQDLAFEQIVDGSPRKRHHVRLWRVTHPAHPGDTLWVGAASYDRSVGFSPYTGEVVHHIETQVDDEREKLADDLARVGRLGRIDRAAGWRDAGWGRNGSGDAYRTDGLLGVLILRNPSRPCGFSIPASEVVDRVRAAVARPSKSGGLG